MWNVIGVEHSPSFLYNLAGGLHNMTYEEYLDVIFKSALNPEPSLEAIDEMMAIIVRTVQNLDIEEALGD